MLEQSFKSFIPYWREWTRWSSN